jgi:hypothetical protein
MARQIFIINYKELANVGVVGNIILRLIHIVGDNTKIRHCKVRSNDALVIAISIF